jgi:hypothetical protein
MVADRMLKAAVMCYTNERWREALPLNLIRIRTAFQSGPLSISTWTENSQRATDRDSRPTRFSASHRSWPGSNKFRQRATPAKPTFVNRDLCRHVTVRTQRAGLWSPLTAGHTTSCFWKRKRYNSLCAASHRVYRQGQTDLHIQQDRLRERNSQPCGQRNLTQHHRPHLPQLYRLHVPVATSAFPHASTPKQPSPRGGLMCEHPTRLHFADVGYYAKVCCMVGVEVKLRSTVSRPVRLGVRHPSGTRDQFFFLLEIFCRQLRACHL